MLRVVPALLSTLPSVRSWLHYEAAAILCGCAWILLNNCWLLEGGGGFVFITSRLKHHRNYAQTLANNWISTFARQPASTATRPMLMGPQRRGAFVFHLQPTRRMGWTGSSALRRQLSSLLHHDEETTEVGHIGFTLPQHSFSMNMRSLFLHGH